MNLSYNKKVPANFVFAHCLDESALGHVEYEVVGRGAIAVLVELDAPLADYVLVHHNVTTTHHYHYNKTRRVLHHVNKY